MNVTVQNACPKLPGGSAVGGVVMHVNESAVGVPQVVTTVHIGSPPLSPTGPIAVQDIAKVALGVNLRTKWAHVRMDVCDLSRVRW